MIQTTTRARLSLSPPMCLSTRTLFPPNKHFTHFTTFHLYVEIHFYTADGPGPCHWSLVPCGLVAKIQHSHCNGLTSVSGQEPKSCFKPLQTKATRDQYHCIQLPFHNLACHLPWWPQWLRAHQRCFSTSAFGPILLVDAPEICFCSFLAAWSPLASNIPLCEKPYHKVKFTEIWKRRIMLALSFFSLPSCLMESLMGIVPGKQKWSNLGLMRNEKAWQCQSQWWSWKGTTHHVTTLNLDFISYINLIWTLQSSSQICIWIDHRDFDKCHLYCNSRHLRAYWPRNSIPMWETRYQFHFKMWCNWQMLILTKIPSRRWEIKCSEIYLCYLFSFTTSLSSTKQEYVYLILNAYWELQLIFHCCCGSVSILEIVRVLEKKSWLYQILKRKKQISKYLMHYGNHLNEKIYI